MIRNYFMICLPQFTVEGDITKAKENFKKAIELTIS